MESSTQIKLSQKLNSCLIKNFDIKKKTFKYKRSNIFKYFKYEYPIWLSHSHSKLDTRNLSNSDEWPCLSYPPHTNSHNALFWLTDSQTWAPFCRPSKAPSHNCPRPAPTPFAPPGPSAWPSRAPPPPCATCRAPRFPASSKGPTSSNRQLARRKLPQPAANRLKCLWFSPFTKVKDIRFFLIIP